MLYHNRRRRRFLKIKCIILAVFLLLLLIIVFCERKISNLTPNFVQNQAEIIANDAICNAVNNTLEALNYNYDDITRIKYSDSGNVQSIETDSIKINKLKSDITKAVQEEISKIYDSAIDIPLGCFTGISVLSNFGPNINVNYNITGSFSCKINSTFESSGINQTVHHINLILTSNIITTSLDYNKKTTLTTDFEIAQSVIIGSVPSGYGSIYRTY